MQSQSAPDEAATQSAGSQGMISDTFPCKTCKVMQPIIDLLRKENIPFQAFKNDLSKPSALDADIIAIVYIRESHARFEDPASDWLKARAALYRPMRLDHQC
jgi:hypothetical protein